MSGKAWDGAQAMALLKDATFWSFILIWLGEGIGGFGITYTFPSVVYELGFTGTAEAQLATMVRSPSSMGIVLPTSNSCC